jgi:predicted ATPase/DNA-binding CsgD family transcriptional regulator
MPAESTTASFLPAEVASLVGRREDLLKVRRLFSGTRLLTLTGIGGVGKTRLALQVAREMQRAFPDGVCLVEFAAISEQRLLRQAVLDALGVREFTTDDTLNSLRGFLGRRRMLLVLDNCEHLVEGAAELVQELLRTAPELRILVTSRQPLRVTGEHVYPVAPLLVPDPEGAAAGDAITQFPAVQLLAERTAAVVPGFEVTPANEAAVARLSNRLEGIPLAIELAAVRLNVLTVQELVDRLDDRFQVLRAGHRNLPERHRTLQALVDWSYDLCTPPERLMWARASVFAGTFTLDALTGVCADEHLPADEIVDVVTGLVEKSVLVREDHGLHARFRMLETLREYGRGRLVASGEAQTLARAHCDWYTAIADRVTAEWIGPEQEDWAELVHLDHSNLRLALEHCVSSAQRAPVAIRIAGQTWFWSATAHMHEATLWLDRALALAVAPTPQRSWGLAARGYIAAFLGEREILSSLPEQARDMALAVGDAGALAFAQHVIGFRQSLSPANDVREAIPLLTEALRQYQEAGTVVQYRHAAVVELAVTLIKVGDLDRAADLTDDLFARCAAAGERFHRGYALWLRGVLALIRGDTAAARGSLTESVTIQRTFRDHIGLLLALEALAWSLAAAGDDDRAATILAGTDAAWEAIGDTEKTMHGWRVHLLSGRPRAVNAARHRELGLEDAVAHALGEHPEVDGGGPRSDPALAQLTRRERQVAELVAQGLSNKQIAATLVVSLRTAEGHVERILTKLGFRTRAQIASWFTEMRATESAGPVGGQNR